MWNEDSVTIDVQEVDRDLMLVRITTPIGAVDLIGSIRIDGDELKISDAHIQGLHPGALGRSGLNAIARTMMLAADVRKVVIQGGTRTTGPNAGREPKRIHFPRKDSASFKG